MVWVVWVVRMVWVAWEYAKMVVVVWEMWMVVLWVYGGVRGRAGVWGGRDGGGRAGASAWVHAG